MAIALNPVYAPAPQPFSLPRSGSIAAAIALHAALVGVLFVPLQSQDITPVEEITTVVDLQPPTPIKPTEPPPLRVVPRPTPAAPIKLPVPLSTIQAPTLPTETPSLVDVPAPQAANTDDRGTSDGSEAAFVTLEVREGGAPPYPRQALRHGMAGEVTLLVRVGLDGRVLAVDIERSSGHRVLDVAAARHVQGHWRFEPARRDGQPVEAWARVPIRFSLPAGR